MKPEDFLKGEDFTVESKEPQSVESFLGGGDFSFDASQAALAHSQATIDRMRQEARVAEAEAQRAATPTTIVGETIKGTAKGIAELPREAFKTLVAKPATRFSQALFAGAGKLMGGEIGTKMQKATEQPIEVPLVGTIEPQKQFGEGGAKQIAGQAIESAAYIAPETRAGRAILGALGQGVKTQATKLGGFLRGALAKRAEKKSMESTLEAVYSGPTGAKFKKTSGQILTGQREIAPASMFREQGITPEQQTINLATRLKGLGLGKDPVKNTQILADDFIQTEAKLQKALTGDPEIQYLADKSTLIGKLNKVKTDAPQEFRIKDSQAMVDNVVSFANKIVAKADDSIGGVREARKAFDAQAKREFPNAFKPDGSIDTKTPAGYAIKKVRDDINEHLYNTAPNGSEIQNLIGHEADLYNAARIAVEKASSGEGKTALAQWIKENPHKAKMLETAGILTLGATGWSLVKPD